MIRLILKLVQIGLPIAVLLGVVNYYVDPANVFRAEKYTKDLASIILAGHNVDNVLNYDERLLQKEIISNDILDPDVVVLGSSRIMEIGADFFPGKKVRNLGVSHANINDLSSITGLIDKYKYIPKQLILNIDPFLFADNATSEWKSIGQYHFDFLDKYCKTENSFQIDIELPKWTKLFSFPYFKESIHFYFSGKNTNFIDIGNEAPVVYGRFADGSVAYSEAYKNPDTKRMGTIGERQAYNDRHVKIDTSKLHLLNCILDYFLEKEVKVQVIILPFHASYYASLNAVNKNFFTSFEKLVFSYLDAKKIPYQGSFDPNTDGYLNTDFYDIYHCSKESIRIHNNFNLQ